jgi:hypothetical protein
MSVRLMMKTARIKAENVFEKRTTVFVKDLNRCGIERKEVVHSSSQFFSHTQQ